MHNYSSHQHGTVRSEDSIGQFSYGPATQTTVVTTTTTTTTKFPPFVMHASRNPDRLDSKLYPLANIQTPAQLRKIVFSHHGKQVIFREAADTTIAFENVVSENERLTRGKGVVQSVQQTGRNLSELQDPPRPSSKPSSDEPASPTSIADDNDEGEDVDEFSLDPSIQRRRDDRSNLATDRDLRGHPRLRDIRTTNPITPETQNRAFRTIRSQPIRASPSRGTLNHNLLPSPDTEQQDSGPVATSRSPSAGETSFEEEIQARINMSRAMTSRASHETTVPTPPVEPEDGQPASQLANVRALSSIPSRLHVTASPAQEGNLPSPSLSPVTAAASAQLSGYFQTSASEQSTRSIGEEMILDDSSSGRYGSPAETEVGDGADAADMIPYSFSNSSFSNIPAMLDFFEVLPGDMKSYVMHQLLRRCPKMTLHVVAEAVNPALKCDFLTLLPPELALNILGYLDVKSLCRASQVSRKWRLMINGDERAWKRLFDADGFALPGGELQLAITQGWGWQDPCGVDGFEQDFSSSGFMAEEVESSSPISTSTSTISKKWSQSALRRSKRKAASSLASGRSKQLKRLDGSRETSVDPESMDWMTQVSPSEGPYNAANAALMAVPSPPSQLQSLKGLHLYKSLYRRHHLIRRNWMVEDTKPRHIAFRAHDSHVVTCLQFDTEKILTGSDDNNINVYDTKTGALRQLLRGHEGGVWALQYEGNILVSGSTDRSVRVWDIDRGIETQVFRGHTSTVRCLQIVTPVKVGETAEGKAIMMPKHPLIITGSRDSTLRVWKLPRQGDPMFIQAESDAESDDCPYFVRTLTGHQHSVRAIAAHADTLVSGSYDCTVRVWRISTGETVHRLQGHSMKVYSVVLDHARNRCISGSMDNLVKIWSLDTGSALYTLEGHSSLVGLLDLNCDRLVSAAADSTLRIWDPENGQCKATLSAHTGAITCFQHDGQKVISGSDRTLKMWNIKTGECMKDLLSDLSGVWQVKFNERRCVAAVQRDNMTYIEVLDFGASRDGVPESQRGRRIVVDAEGQEVDSNADDTTYPDSS